MHGLYVAFAACAKELGVDHRLFKKCIEPGLIAIVHVGLYDPRWGNPTRDQLLSPIAGEVVAKVLRAQLVEGKQLRAFFEARLRAVAVS